jgi:predicted RNA binding protein YcfA (HicA-like mRNA interferase family)
VTPRLPAVTPRQAVRALTRCGWQLDRVGGATTSFVTQVIRVVVPTHARDLARGTLNAISEAEVSVARSS